MTATLTAKSARVGNRTVPKASMSFHATVVKPKRFGAHEPAYEASAAK
jgi:hypothetical protein